MAKPQNLSIITRNKLQEPGYTLKQLQDLNLTIDQVIKMEGQLQEQRLALENLGKQFNALTIKLDYFDGSGDLENFFKDFDRYCDEIGRITDDQKLNCLIGHLKGEAKDCFRLVANPTFATVKEALSNRFKPTDQQKYTIKAQLYTMRQLPGESFKQFVTRLQQKSRGIDISEQDLVSVALNGARPVIRAHLAMKEPTTINQLLKLPLAVDDDFLYEESPGYEALNTLADKVDTLQRTVSAAVERPPHAQVHFAEGADQDRRRRPVSPARRRRTPSPASRPRQTFTRTPTFGTRTDTVRKDSTDCSKCATANCEGGRRCPAYGKECRRCHYMHHFARCCKTGQARLHQRQSAARQMGRNSGNRQ